jgi:ADP-ribosylglycohydrolase
MHKLRTLREKVAALVSKQETDLAREHESVCCFVTFENDEGKDAALALARALKLNAKKWKAKTTCMLPCEWLHPDPLLRPPDSNTPDFMFRDNLKLAIQRAKEPEDIQ